MNLQQAAHELAAANAVLHRRHGHARAHLRDVNRSSPDIPRRISSIADLEYAREATDDARPAAASWPTPTVARAVLDAAALVLCRTGDDLCAYGAVSFTHGDTSVTIGRPVTAATAKSPTTFDSHASTPACSPPFCSAEKKSACDLACSRRVISASFDTRNCPDTESSPRLAFDAKVAKDYEGAEEEASAEAESERGADTAFHTCCF